VSRLKDELKSEKEKFEKVSTNWTCKEKETKDIEKDFKNKMVRSFGLGFEVAAKQILVLYPNLWTFSRR